MKPPLGVHKNDGTDNAGKPLNINDDTVAGELAPEPCAERLVFLTDVGGVMDDGGRVIRRLDRRRVNALLNSGVPGGGTIPKLQACLRALEGSRESSPVAEISMAPAHALIDCIEGRSSGTTITG